MIKNLKLFCMFSILVVLITLTVFIISHKEELFKEDKNTEIIKEEDVSLLIIEPDFLNPLVSHNKYVQEISNLVFDGLTKLDESLKPRLVLAKTFIPNDNLTEWTVTLRDDVVFHDGSKFTADDVIFTVNKIKELNDKSYFAYNVKNIDNITKLSDYELKITLNKTDNFLMNKMTFPILAKNYYYNKMLEKTDKYVGTGVYKQESVMPEVMTLKAFSDYYDKVTGNIKNINVKIISKARPGFELLKLNEIDVADTNIEVGAYGRSAYSSSKYVTSIFEGIIFNSENEILKDNVIRQAILLGINRDLIIENYLNGYGISIDLPVNPNSYLYNKELIKYSYNPEKAQDLLVNNGWNLGALNVRTKVNNKLEFNFLINSDSKNSQDKAEFIKENLGKIGVKVNIIAKESTKYNTSIAMRDYDIALTDWAISEYPEFLYNFDSNSPDNIFGFSNEDYDYYAFMAKTEYLEGKSKEYFSKMQEILANYLPMAGLYFETSTVYYNQSIEGEFKPTINNIYSGIENMMLFNT